METSLILSKACSTQVRWSETPPPKAIDPYIQT